MIFRKKPLEVDAEEQEVDPQRPSFLSRINLQFLSPIHVLGNLWDFFVAWRSTRKWGSIAFILLPFFLMASLFICVALGKSKSKEDLLQWYASEATKQVEEEEKRKDELRERGELSPEQVQLDGKDDYTDLLFKRVLQLDRNNKRARYFVALQMARTGRVNSAVSMMQELAPKDEKGFSLAHAWLAMAMIEQSQRGQPVDIEVLKHHLKQASMSQNINPSLLLVYAELLKSDSNLTEATELIKRAAKSDTRMQINVISTFLQQGLTEQAIVAADTLVAEFKDKLADDKSDEYRLMVAQAYGMTNRLKEAMDVLQEGLKLKPGSARIRRALSDTQRTIFRHSVHMIGNSQVRMALDFLNSAIAVDPTNLAIQNELSLINQMASGDSNAIVSAMNQQIAVRGTSYVARLFLAEVALQRGETEKAIQHYELVLGDLPNMTLALNNASMMMAKSNPEAAPQALAMIQKAVDADPNNAEFYDTRAEIKWITNQRDEAIADFKLALEKDRARVNTYTRLIECLRATGKETEASEQEEVLAKVKEWLEKREELIQSERAKLQAAQQNALLQSGQAGELPAEAKPEDSIFSQEKASPNEGTGKPASESSEAVPSIPVDATPAGESTGGISDESAKP